MAIPKKRLPTATPEQFEGNTLMRMRMEGVKAVRLIDLTFDQPLTVIGGDFSQGKSTYLSGYEWCFGGKAVIDLDPIQHGRQSGTIICDIGDGEKVTLRVTCLLERVGESGWTRSIELEIPGHMTPTKVQDFLESLAGTRSFDPMSFDAMKPDQQYETLRGLVADFDFAANNLAYDTTFKERTDINRDQKREQAAADAIEVADTPPCERVDEEALTKELEDAGKKNLEIQGKKERRATAATDITRLRQNATDIRATIETESESIRQSAADDVAALELQIRGLQKRIEERAARVDIDLAARVKIINDAADSSDKSANALQAKLDAAPTLDEPVKTEEITAKLNAGRLTNKTLSDWQVLRDRRSAHQKEADRLADKSAAFTKTLDDLEAAKLKAIEDAQLPVDGLGFGDGFVMLKGVPWKQAGESERVDASTAIAMALNPRLKVILIRDGSGVAKRMRERIRQRAAAKGYRVLMEVVDTPEGTTVVIEDGQVKSHESTEVAA